jgi:hypothetical protein
LNLGVSRNAVHFLVCRVFFYKKYAPLFRARLSALRRLTAAHPLRAIFMHRKIRRRDTLLAFMARHWRCTGHWRLWQGRDGRRKNRDGRTPGLLTQVLQSFTRRCGMLNVFEHYIFMRFSALAGGAAAKAFANAEAEARRCAICTPRTLRATELRNTRPVGERPANYRKKHKILIFAQNKNRITMLLVL